MLPRLKLPFVSLVVLLIMFKEATASFDQASRILPSDSYQILGQTGFRRLGQCNFTYAWLIPPPASNLDAYGHALACSRLQLQDGRIVRSPMVTDTRITEESSRADEEWKHVNKEMAATLVDLNRLDILMRAERLVDGGYRVLPGGPLADADRYFYLADRVGSLNILVMFRPGQQIKLELIDPISADHLVTPQHVLCSRKQCPPVPVTTEDTVLDTNSANQYSNQSRTLSSALAKADRHNRELYMQLIISRVACALLSFLCIVFAITALALCIRLRRYPGYCRKPAPPSEISVYREQNHSPSYYQANGKLHMGQPSPVYLTEASPRHGGMSQMISDAASVNNVVMTTSNLSECGAIGGMGGAPISYTALTPQYGHLPAYAIPGSRASIYNDASGMVTLVPVNSRGIFLSHQNGSSSPVPSNHSYTDSKSGIVRSGSLGRYSGGNLSYSEAARRKLMRSNRNNYRSDLQTQNGANNMGMNEQVQGSVQQQQQQQNMPAPPPLATPIPTVNHQHLSQGHSIQNSSAGQLSCEQHGTDLLLKTNSITMPNDLITFQANSQLASVIHRYPGEVHSYKVSTARGSEKEDCDSPKLGQVNHLNESCVALIRKPALAN
ncbi:hypothetical protein D915_001039 [Fasciola hepatica]|uniref:Uncharacterized protein n=1 Tax=Fasciola hepatica TaxID=6192 RepID=A0A4E0RL98_FASHE|nr:hypothetical protein D915_001039 [Fasciola hepatica]